MQILHLTLKKRWFDLIASGAKTTEYREQKPYWHSRLTNDGRKPTTAPYDLKKFDEIHFRNGYSPDAPFMRVKHKTTILGHSDDIASMHGEPLDGYYYLICLGDVLEVRA